MYIERYNGSDIMKKIQIMISIIYFMLFLPVVYVGCGSDGGGHGSNNFTTACFDRAVFGDPSESEYVLPYPVGEQYEIIQSYCYQENSHYNSLAYDFLMPLGSDNFKNADGPLDSNNGLIAGESYLAIPF